MQLYALIQKTSYINYKASVTEHKITYISVLKCREPIIYACDYKRDAIFYTLPEAEYWQKYLSTKGKTVEIEYVETNNRDFTDYLHAQIHYPLN